MGEFSDNICIILLCAVFFGGRVVGMRPITLLQFGDFTTKLGVRRANGLDRAFSPEWTRGAFDGTWSVRFIVFGFCFHLQRGLTRWY